MVAVRDAHRCVDRGFTFYLPHKVGVSAIELCQQQFTETQRINANLERIVAALDKRPQG